MSIADKLTTVAENTPKVYDAGYNKAESDFWDAYQENGERKNYKNAFACFGWTDTTFKPRYNIAPTNAYTMFDTSYITDIKAALERQGVVLDLSKATNVYCAFQVCRSVNLPVLDISSATNTSSMFYACTWLKNVEKLIVSETTNINTNMFAGTDNLEHIIFEGIIAKAISVTWCKKLDHDSLMSIINCLKDYSGSGTTYTCTLGATNLEKLTDAEKAIATEKGWTLA